MGFYNCVAQKFLGTLAIPITKHLCPKTGLHPKRCLHEFNIPRDLNMIFPYQLSISILIHFLILTTCAFGYCYDVCAY